MYEIDYEKAKYAFAQKTRIDDSLDGSFEVIGKITDNVIDFENVLAKNHERFEAFYFESKCCDILREMRRVELCKTATKKFCQITTDAPRMEWSVTNFNCVDKIIINRYSIDDNENSKKAYEDALTVADYKKMASNLKAKCAFRVDCERAVITKVEQLYGFIEFVRKVGINEIVFVAEKQLKHIECKPKKEVKGVSLEDCIEKIRNGEKLKIKAVEPMKFPNGAPLFFTMRDLLIMQGGHLVINKAISERNNFFTKLTVKIGDLNVVFKQRITDQKLQSEMWQHSLSHKYVVEL